MTDGNSGQKSARAARGRFAKGNPGKPYGSRHRATQAVQALLDGEAEALTRRAITLAMDGDPTALRLCIERLSPPPKDAPVIFPIPKMEAAADAAGAVSAVVAAVACGDLTPTQGERIAGIIEAWRRAIETTELAARVEALEAAAPR
jgi:hypothetical protein